MNDVINRYCCLIATSLVLMVSGEHLMAQAPAPVGTPDSVDEVARPETAAATDSEADGRISARMSAGGTGRYRVDRWGMTKAIVHNLATEPQDVLLVVTPPNSGGVQFARSIQVPAQASTETSWPIWISSGETGNLDFEYLTFPGGVETEVIQRTADDPVLSVYSALVRGEGPGMSAWLASGDVTDAENNKVQRLIRALRYAVHRDVAITSLVPREITSHAESLDAISQVVVSHNRLADIPEACECLRLWVQRGGRLLVCMDQTGPEGLEHLLGNALPFAVVGETSANVIPLQLNSSFRTDSYPIREVVREFDEPVRYVRIVASQGEPIWTVDGWPVALQIPYGLGTVVVTTISPDVFYKRKERVREDDPEFEPVASMRRIQDALFVINPPHQLDHEVVAAEAAAQIGYTIPPRSFALLVTLGFPLLLLCCGAILLQAGKGERLLWITPLLAVALAIPAVSKGMVTRDVASPTAIQTQQINAVSGQSLLVSDGVATVYSPDSSTMIVHADNGAILEPPIDPGNRDYRRLIWSGTRQNSWARLKQPRGVSALKVRSLRQLSQPLEAVATFTSDGLRGQLQLAELTAPRDAIFTGLNPDVMAVNMEPSGQFRIESGDVLGRGAYFRDTLLTDEQRQHAAVYSSFFDATSRADAFPRQSSIMYWADAPEGGGVQVGDEATVRSQQLLVTQPLVLEPPVLGEMISIPPGFIPFQVVVDDNGSFSSVFNSAKRMWDPNGREGRGSVRLQFDLPAVCLPFETKQVVATVRIRAGSRTVKLSAGRPGEFHPATTLNSPVGSFEMDLPIDAVQGPLRDGRLWLQLDISDLDLPDSDEPAVGEQDDSWVIERLALSVRGQRVEASTPPDNPQ